ncbi:MAG TPA: DNA-formamidopyrimidine glycosylase family protein, partial [Thermoanaerobaculia bacterium]
MPELPEVEIYARYFRRHALHQRIARVRVIDERILGVTRKGTLIRRLTGRQFTEVRRHGKHLFAAAGGKNWLHLHFGMTGDLAYSTDGSGQPRFARVVFDFESGARLVFEDMRLFGIVDLTTSPDDYIRDHRLGPDPLDPAFTLREFRRRLGRRRGAIKALLMSQEFVAGVGNLYADETLFRSSIHPTRSAERLTSDEAKTMYTNMRRVLNDMVALKAREGEYPARTLVMHREEDDRCPRCGGEIRRTVVGGRTTYY